MSTRYFALIGIEPAPSGLMREVRDAEELALEYLDGQGNWVFDASLVKYPLLGEHDAVLIDEAAALALAQELTLGQGMKEAPPPPDREVEEEHYAAVLEKALAAVRRRVERWLREHEAEGQKHLPGKHDQRTHGRGGIGLDPGSITQEREGLFLREGLPGGGHILLTRGTDRGVAEANLRDINEALGIVPKEHIQGLNKVLAEMGDPRLFGSEAYIGSDDAIWLSDAWSAKGRTDRVQGIVHEIGHRYQTRISPKSFSEFRKAGLGKHVESLIKPEFLSNYPKGEKRDAEAFAESYARFHQKKSLPSDLQTFWSRSGQKALFAQKQLSLGLLNLSDDPEFWATVKEDFLADIAKADPPVSAARLMQRGAAEAASLGLAVDFSLVNEQALETAAKYTNEWWQALEGSTRDGLRKAIQTNIETGAPLRGLIKDIEPLFGKGRASAIAATEVTRLYAEGNRFAYASVGIQQVEWRTVRDSRVDPLCDSLNGQRWQLGREDYVPPRHPRCRCRLVPVVESGETLNARSQEESRVGLGWEDNPWKMFKGAPKRPLLTASEVGKLKAQLANRKALRVEGPRGSSEIVTLLYHVTVPDNIAEILERGLVPHARSAPGQPWKALHSDYATYFHPSLDAAKANVDQAREIGADASIVVARLPVTSEALRRVIPDEDVDLDVSKGLEALGNQEAVAIIGGIPSEGVSVLEY
ncbi:MAG TPA: minor capsid protein [Anaerolineales bacterium]|nr:minor capsid protein [Anaerolineales bacterium]